MANETPVHWIVHCPNCFVKLTMGKLRKHLPACQEASMKWEEKYEKTKTKLENKI